MECYLALTAAELAGCREPPEHMAWMACHFSPYATGLSNLPKALPPGSLLILDDVTPPHGHNPVLIAQQLLQCTEALGCYGVLLDFERAACAETEAIAKHLAATLPCPTAVSANYAGDLDCPVFLPVMPPSVPLEAYLSPWKGREIWLEIGLEGELLTLTQQGCEATPLSYLNPEMEGFADKELHCHYTIETNEKAARFTLWRTSEDIKQLLEEAETLGITAAVGLFQELHRFTGQ